jgi:hypothetical protein
MRVAPPWSAVAILDIRQPKELPRAPLICFGSVAHIATTAPEKVVKIF